MKNLLALLTVVMIIVTSVLPVSAEGVAAEDEKAWENKICDTWSWEAMKAENPNGTTKATVLFATRAEQKDVTALYHKKMEAQGFVYDEKSQSFDPCYYSLIAKELGLSVDTLDKASIDVSQRMISYYNQANILRANSLFELNEQLVLQYLADYPEINSIGKILHHNKGLCGLYMELSVADIEALAKLDCVYSIGIEYGETLETANYVDTSSEAEEHLSLAGRGFSYSGYIPQDDIWTTGVNSNEGQRAVPVIHRFDSVAELEAFVQKYGPFNSDYDEVISAAEKLAEYDNGFFSSYALLLVYFTSSGSCRWQINGVTWYENSKTLDISYRATLYPEWQSDNISGWFLTVPVLKSKIEGCLEYTVDFWEWNGEEILPEEPTEDLPLEDSSEEPSSEEPSEDASSEEVSEELSSEDLSSEDFVSDEGSFEDSLDDESSDGAEAVAYGDVNGDGDINSLDAAQTLKHDARLTTLEGDALVLADVNRDGSVDSLDAAQILKYDAQLISSFIAEAA
ncbi:MAG: dockerin type I repeat-containing protein [Clostridia bacterium]|nr:dockerin type I repeat-containing protein [Clostridia bacterium]